MVAKWYMKYWGIKYQSQSICQEYLYYKYRTLSMTRASSRKNETDMSPAPFLKIIASYGLITISESESTSALKKRKREITSSVYY